MAKFHGSIEELKKLLLAAGCDGEWRELPNGVYKLTTRDRAGMNWSASKGTIWFDGPTDARASLEAKVERAIGNGDPVVPADVSGGTIFVVHGHDTETREQLELILHRLGLEPFVLQNSDGGGKTIIESLEHMIGKNAASSFGIVLMTPDDLGYAKSAGAEEAKGRARQNVILEMGMLLASLTRERVAILQKGFVERPSDVDGILYIPFNDHVREAVPKLVGRLNAAGIKLEASAIARASA